MIAGIFITQQELIHQGIEVKQLDRELTAEVMEKVDLVCALFYIIVARESIAVDILEYSIPESTFADCLQPVGHMDTDVFYLQCKLLSKD